MKVPYLMFCIAFLILAAIFFMIHLPHVGEGKVEPGAGALRYPHVVLGVLAIFMYVGGEVSIGSSIINFLGQKNVASMSAIDAKNYVSLFWGGMLIGRFMGAIELSEMQKAKKQLFLVVVPLLAYLFLWTAISAPLDAMHGGSSFGAVLGLWETNFVNNWSMFKIYLPLVALCWLLFQFGRALPGRTLGHLLLDHRRPSGACNYFRRKNGRLVRRRRWPVYVHWLAEYFLTCPRWHGRPEKPGFIAAGYGGFRWRAVTSVDGRGCRHNS